MTLDLAINLTFWAKMAHFWLNKEVHNWNLGTELVFDFS